MNGTDRPKCPECRERVDIQIRNEGGEETASYVHCGHYWTFAPEQPTANEVRNGCAADTGGESDG